MNKMNVIVRFTILIILYGKSTISQSLPPKTGKPKLGNAVCMYYGSIDRCCQTIVPVDKIKDICTSFFMDGLFVDSTFAIQNSYSDTDEEHMLDLISIGKPVIIAYGYEKAFPWSNVLDCILEDSNAQCQKNLLAEFNSLQDYHKGLNINGFILKNVFDPDSNNLEYISEKLKKYVNTMKGGKSDFLYGLEIDGYTLEVLTNCPDSSTRYCFDFTILCETFDLLVITTDNLNQCSAEYSDGIAPVDKGPGVTLTRLASILSCANVPKDQIYYMLALNPQVTRHQGPGCNPTSSQKCKGTLNQPPNFIYDTICMDTSLTFNQKGQFIKLNAAGFIGVYIDADDPTGDCKCSNSFPAFNFILNGINDGKMETCELFDKPFNK